MEKYSDEEWYQMIYKEADTYCLLFGINHNEINHDEIKDCAAKNDLIFRF